MSEKHEGIMPEQFKEGSMGKYRDLVKIIGGEFMIFGVNEEEATNIEAYAKQKGVDVQRTNLSEGEMKKYRTQEGLKYGIIFEGTVEARKKLFNEDVKE